MHNEHTNLRRNRNSCHRHTFVCCVAWRQNLPRRAQSTSASKWEVSDLRCNLRSHSGRKIECILTGPLATVQIASLLCRPLSRCTPPTPHLRAIDTNLNSTCDFITSQAVVESERAVAQKHIPTVKFVMQHSSADAITGFRADHMAKRCGNKSNKQNKRIRLSIVDCVVSGNGLATTPAHSAWVLHMKVRFSTIKRMMILQSASSNTTLPIWEAS